MFFPDWLLVMLISSLPIGELRAGLPIALTVYDMQVWHALFFSIIGNIIPGLVVYFLIDPVSRLLSRLEFFRKFFEWLFERTRKKFNSKYTTSKFLILVLFIGIPLPITGVWTGALAAWLFAMRPKYAIPGMILGLCMSALIVLIITLGFSGTLNIFN